MQSLEISFDVSDSFAFVLRIKRSRPSGGGGNSDIMGTDKSSV